MCIIASLFVDLIRKVIAGRIFHVDAGTSAADVVLRDPLFGFSTVTSRALLRANGV